MQAREARVSADGEQVTLLGNVVVERAPLAQRPLLHAETESLKVLPDAEKASTDATVRITEGPSWVQGTGMEVDQKAQTFVLRSQVTGTFTPKQGPKQ
jgi:LPS export ABC transporter protein LptC